MKIYVDADACPKNIKDIACRAAIRTRCELIFVANQRISIPASPFIFCIQVNGGFDVADNYIVDKVQSNELVITADIPFAAQVLEKGAFALNPRGELYSKDSIKQRLALRNFMDEVRSSGVHTGGPKAMDKNNIQKFSNALDSYLAKYSNK